MLVSGAIGTPPLRRFKAQGQGQGLMPRNLTQIRLVHDKEAARHTWSPLSLSSRGRVLLTGRLALLPMRQTPCDSDSSMSSTAVICTRQGPLSGCTASTEWRRNEHCAGSHS